MEKESNLHRSNNKSISLGHASVGTYQATGIQTNRLQGASTAATVGIRRWSQIDFAFDRVKGADSARAFERSVGSFDYYGHVGHSSYWLSARAI